MSDVQITPQEIVQATRMVHSTLVMLTQIGGLAGIILTDEAYDSVKSLFGNAALPHRPAELDLDPNMEHTFVVEGLLILRGTKLQ